MSGGGRWTKINSAVKTAAETLYPILSALRAASTRPRVYSSSDRRVHIIDAVLPASWKALRIAVYVTCQESRPLTPRDIVKRLMRLKKSAAPSANMDVTYLLVLCGNTRTTVAARAVAARFRVKPVRPREALSIVMRYIEARLEGLRRLFRERGDRLSRQLRRELEALELTLAIIHSRLIPYVTQIPPPPS